MSFMQLSSYTGKYWTIETPNGNTFLPCDYVGTLGLNVEDSISYRFPTEQEKRETNAKQPRNPFSEYVDSDIVYSAALCDGMLCRLSAPGYMDCTDWTPCESEEDALEQIAELYGDDDDSGDE